ncbi:SusC/RagA family TonB-linked outer membrane protein [Chitinophaga silvatica]|uniref:SusC/RagA family TonB-linked outer membrane protein n=1 Tax=Chitinophaga silvatica TaxID=2282649 RepID=A0A3E1YES5_9BACT|nr:SusC/RagA family TonB-linked outer membrane protein [Chitinophaga silvatica]RFS24963.1 SusC/RagA family TonB-linked outer membrane protein [Chitinophaga silvatica]
MKKKLRTAWYFSRHVLPKTFLFMKLTAVVIMATCLQISAKGYSQKVTLSESNSRLSKVFRVIKKQTGFSFFFDEAWLKQAEGITINVKDVSLEAALDICFKDLPLTYSIVGNTVVVKPREEAPISAAQANPPINGVITDGGKLPLAGVSVRIKGTDKGTITNEKGEFTLNAKPGDVLEISFVGFKKQQVTIGQDSKLKIVMETGSSGLGEVVVTALGIGKNDKTLGYAITTLKGEELTRTNTVNPITALQGKVAGVNVSTMTAAGVQTSPFIQIRGAKVLGTPGNNTNQPIFVIDGNVLTNNVSNADDADPGSQLKNLNPDDYESVTILKGAAATALYGSRGINGAVVITTKKAKVGQAFQVDLGSTYQTQQIYRAPMDLQNVYGQGSALTREGNFRPDGTQSQTTASWGPKMDGSLHPAVYDPSIKVPYSPQPDNWKAFYQNGNFINNNIAISSATDKFNYRLSYSNNHTNGTLPNNGMQRNSVALKIGAKLNDIFSTDFGVSYSNTVAKNFFSQGRWAYGGGQNLAFNTYYLPRNIDFQEWHNTYRRADNGINGNAFGNLISAQNAFARFDKNNYYRHENSVLGYLQLKAQVNPWLDLSARGNLNLYKIRTEEKNYGNDINNAGGYYASGGSYTGDYTMLFMAHAVKTAMNNDLTIDMRLYNEDFGDMYNESYGASINGALSVPNQFFLGNSSQNIQSKYYYGTQDVPGPRYPSQLTIGVGGILNLNYKQYLNLELTGRNDWRSTLTYPVAAVGAHNNYSIFYPAANLSYSFYDHFHNSMPMWLSAGRLRASLAYVGNSGIAGPYQTGVGYSPATIYNQNGASVGTATQYNADTKPNLNLKAQISRTWEFGTNFGLFNDLINVDFAWYKTNTFNQLIKLGGVPETGYSQVFFNAGNIQNKGWELLVNVSPIRSKDWGLDFAVNMARNKSKIIEFGNGITDWNLSDNYEGVSVHAYEGGDFGILTTNNDYYASTAIDSKTGLPIITYDGRLTSTANQYDMANYSLKVIPQGAPNVRIGKVEPDVTGGISGTLRYKNFSLFAQVDGRFGGYVFSESYAYATGQGTTLKTLEGRDKEHGGLPRTDPLWNNGEPIYDGIIPNAVFDEGQMSPLQPGTSIAGMTFKEAYEKKLVEPMKASLYYNTFYGWETNLNTTEVISKNSWVMLREVTLGYRLPAAVSQRLHLKGARLNLSARNIGYLYRTLAGGQNPESLQSNDPFRPFITGGVPFSRNYAATLNITL